MGPVCLSSINTRRELSSDERLVDVVMSLARGVELDRLKML